MTPGSSRVPQVLACRENLRLEGGSDQPEDTQPGDGKAGTRTLPLSAVLGCRDSPRRSIWPIRCRWVCACGFPGSLCLLTTTPPVAIDALTSNPAPARGLFPSPLLPTPSSQLLLTLYASAPLLFPPGSLPWNFDFHPCGLQEGYLLWPLKPPDHPAQHCSSRLGAS